MDPAFIDGRTQEYTAVSAAIIVVAIRAGRGLFKFYCDNRRDVGELLQAREQTFFNAVASPRISEPKKVKTMFSAAKVMTTIFWDSKFVL